MIIPTKFDSILKSNQTLHSIVLDVVTSFEGVLKDNKLYFFEEYTDHGIEHIESVLKSCEFIITENSFSNLKPNEISTLILSVILHDLGMHLEFSTFKAMLNGEYDLVMSSTDSKTWKELWEDYLSEAKRFSSTQKKNIFGKEATPFRIPDLNSKDNLTGVDKKLIGEFIRRHHGRLAHEIALIGLIGEGSTIQFSNDKFDNKNRQLAGLLARSHGMNIRDCFPLLEELAQESWRNPLNINIVFLMVVLRIADYIQIDNNRVNSHLLKIKTFSSPISNIEHQTHLAIESINYNQLDSEKIYVQTTPRDSEQFIKIFNLIKDIQRELDVSWAVLGEVYGFLPHDRPSIRFRRINSNLNDLKYIQKLKYVPEKIGFQVDNNLSKLLVAPLYGDDPTFGVRELIQNAVDSCLERKEIEYNKGNFKYSPKVVVSLSKIDEKNSVFTIKDNGKGMSQYEILNYFLSVGTSFRKSMDWKKQFVDESGKSKIKRSGKFGIGVLAAFLLGDEILVQTKSLNSDLDYSFKATIDSQFINILKESNLDEFGVEISIIIDKHKRKKLLEATENSYYSDNIKWTEWFIYDEPKIVYFLDGKEIKEEKTIDASTFFDFHTNDFDKISWSYTKANRYYASYDHYLVCNGIRITNNYQASSYRAKGKELLIKSKPSILVSDKEGILPLKLDRNELDSSEFPFENELLTEISKFYIAQLLTLAVDINHLNRHVPIFETTILYNKNGFSIDCDYFINGLKDNFNFIRILSTSSSLKLDINKFQNCFFYGTRQEIKLTSQESNVFPKNGGRVLLKKTKFNNLFTHDNNRLPASVKRNIRKEIQNDDFIIYKTLNYSSQSSVLDESIFKNSELLSEIESIQEISPSFFNISAHKITEELFRRYIKDNYIIPYDLEERKTIFYEAFLELKQYMGKNHFT